MSKLAADCGAINLSQGFPDFQADRRCSMPPGARCARAETSTRRWPAWPNCARRSPTRWRRCTAPTTTSSSEITVTAGATQAIFTAIAAFVRSGDEVIVFEPVYDSYVPAIETVGGKAVYATLRFPRLPAGLGAGALAAQPAHADDHHQLAAQPDRQPAGRRRSGAVGGADARYRHRVLADEVYEHIVFDGARAPERRRPSGTRRAQHRRLVFRQDLPHHRLEGRLRARPSRT
jgi:methionine aminotransferase